MPVLQAFWVPEVYRSIKHAPVISISNYIWITIEHLILSIWYSTLDRPLWAYHSENSYLHHQGFRFFSRLVGQSDPWNKKWRVSSQAYQTIHSLHLGSILYLHIDTDTYMHICILTADYTVKPVLSGHSKKKTNYRLMQVKSIAECSKGEHSAILSTFIKLPFVIKIFVLSLMSGCLRHVLLYIAYLHVLPVLWSS